MFSATFGVFCYGKLCFLCFLHGLRGGRAVSVVLLRRSAISATASGVFLHSLGRCRCWCWWCSWWCSWWCYCCTYFLDYFYSFTTLHYLSTYLYRVRSLSQMLPLLLTIQARSPIEGKLDDDDNSTTRNSSNNGNNRNNRLQRNNMKQQALQALQAQRSTHYLLPTTYVLRLMVDEIDIKQSQFPTEKLVTRQIYCLIPDHEVDGCMSFSSICKCEWGTVIPLDCKQRKRYTHKILAIKPAPQQVKTIRKA